MSQAKVHFITGGQRSGKSAYAEKVGLALSDNPIYLATSKKWDDEHNERIITHQNSRASNWITIEEEVNIDIHDFNNQVVLIDCITLWLTNIFFNNKYDKDLALAEAKKIWSKLIAQNCQLIVVSNEIGMGGVAMDNSARRFADLQGLINQHIASLANEVTLTVSGIPVKIK